jgi:hypothetical protein
LRFSTAPIKNVLQLAIRPDLPRRGEVVDGVTDTTLLLLLLCLAKAT